MSINYLTGDATDLPSSGNKVLCHLCNSWGFWGAGFVLALSKKWPVAEAAYRKLYADQGKKLVMGTVQFVPINSDLHVANMIGQLGLRKKDGDSSIRYPALYSCLEEVAKFAVANKASIHAPKFGAGLAGGDWRVIEAILEKISKTYGVDFTIYDFPTQAAPLTAQTPGSDIL